MSARICHHCKQWIAEGEHHDCWSTTEQALTRDLPEDLLDAWHRLREAATALGDQRVYASHHSIMFSRRACYCFVRPKRTFLEVCIFLDREMRAPQVRRVMAASRTRFAHMLRVQHRDEVETPLTEWLARAYQLVDPHIARSPADAGPSPRRAAKKR